MNIKIIGSDCSNGIKLKKNLLKVANSYDGDVEIENLNIHRLSLAL